MARIFISYSRADRQFVDELVPLLHRVYGQDSVWFDDQIYGGVPWWDMILREIARCDLFLYLISNAALESPYCQSELREALRLRKRILPVIARPKTHYPGKITSDLAQTLQALQCVDMTQGFRDAQASARLYAAIDQLLARAPAAFSMSFLSSPVSKPTVPDRSKHPRRARWPWLMAAAGIVLVIAAGVALMVRARGGGDGTTPPLAITAVGANEAGLPAVALVTPLALAATLTPIPTATPTAAASLLTTPEAVFPPNGSDAQPSIDLSGVSNNARQQIERHTQTTLYTVNWGELAVVILFGVVSAALMLLSILAFSHKQCLFTLLFFASAAAIFVTLSTALLVFSFLVFGVGAFSGLPGLDQEPVTTELDVVQALTGCFTMGSYDGAAAEQPAHSVCLNRFWITRTEITNAQYAECVDAGYCSAPQDRTYYADPLRANYPVVNITWAQAKKYADWVGGALPTEAQWEYAARGPESGPYPWGDADPDCAKANYRDCGDASQPAGVTTEARLSGASWIGALDMAGNVGEWVADWYSPTYYQTLDSARNNPVGPLEAQDNLGVLRGGSWNQSALEIRAFVRQSAPRDAYSDEWGFRVVFTGTLP